MFLIKLKARPCDGNGAEGKAQKKDFDFLRTFKELFLSAFLLKIPGSTHKLRRITRKLRNLRKLQIYTREKVE